MKNNYIIIIVLIAISLTSIQKTSNKKMIEENRFIRVDDNLADGTSLIMNRKITNPSSMIGDFLSRIWRIYGKPKQVYFGGFGYTFKDTKTGLIFTAYSGGTGPAYGGNNEEQKQLIPVIKIFDEMLDSTIPADCELKFKTDFGVLKSGAKNGIPYDIRK